MDLSHGNFYKTIEEAKIVVNNIPKYIILFIWFIPEI